MGYEWQTEGNEETAPVERTRIGRCFLDNGFVDSGMG